jgi:formate dehydrogenase assembly factor FdhD
VWKDWEDWGACSKTCGLGGTRKRDRYLTTTKDKPASATATDLHEIIDANRALLERVKNAESTGTEHMVLAFVAGFGGFVLVMFAGRVLRKRSVATAPSFLE